LTYHVLILALLDTVSLSPSARNNLASVLMAPGIAVGPRGFEAQGFILPCNIAAMFVLFSSFVWTVREFRAAKKGGIV